MQKVGVVSHFAHLELQAKIE